VTRGCPQAPPCSSKACKQGLASRQSVSSAKGGRWECEIQTLNLSAFFKHTRAAPDSVAAWLNLWRFGAVSCLWQRSWHQTSRHHGAAAASSLPGAAPAPTRIATCADIAIGVGTAASWYGCCGCHHVGHICGIAPPICTLNPDVAGVMVVLTIGMAGSTAKDIGVKGDDCARRGERSTGVL